MIEILLSALIILSIIAIVLESDNAIYQRYDDALDYSEVITVALFTLEYVLRIWSAPPAIVAMPPHKCQLRYVFSFKGAIDLIAVAPF